MERGWASQTLGGWCGSPRMRLLTPAAETACAGRITKGIEARDTLAKDLFPTLEQFILTSVCLDGEVRDSDIGELIPAVLRRALDLFATSDNPDFPVHLESAIRLEFEVYFDARRRRSKSFDIDFDRWIAARLDSKAIGDSFGNEDFGSPSWGQLRDAGVAVNELVEHGIAAIPAAIASVEKVVIRRIGQEDAEAEALLILRKLAWEYSASEGRRFHQLAVPSIKNHLRSRSRTILGGTEDFAKRLLVFNRTRARLWVRDQKPPTIDQVLSSIEEWSAEQKETFRCLIEVDAAPRAFTDDVDMLPGTAQPPDLIASEIETRRIVNDAMSRLNDSERTVIHCRYYLGMTKAATARQLGRAPTSTTRTEAQALRKLRDVLGHEARGQEFD